MVPMQQDWGGGGGAPPAMPWGAAPDPNFPRGAPMAGPGGQQMFPRGPEAGAMGGFGAGPQPGGMAPFADPSAMGFPQQQ